MALIPDTINSVIRWVTNAPAPQPQRDASLSLDTWAAQWFTYGGNTYGLHQTLMGDAEQIGSEFEQLVALAYKRNGVVFACIQARASLLSQARFQWQQMRGGQPGDLFGTEALALLERPEPGRVTADLLASASVDVDLAGNAFIVKRFVNGALRLKRMEPQYTEIVLGSQSGPQIDGRELNAEVIGYIYYPGGRSSGLKPEFLLPEEVAHLAPVKDPTARYRGMSWLTPVRRDIQSDIAATNHKELFFTNGATPNMVVTITAASGEKFREIVDLIEEGHTGLANAYKTLYIDSNTKAEVVGANFQQADFKGVQGAGEVRIASAAGIHPVILGLSEGLQGSSLNQGNFMAARRLVADMTLRPWWGNVAASLETIMPPPSGARLWYDDRHIPFLAEDVKDAAEVQQAQSATIQSLINAGYKPDAVIDAVTAGDYERLKGQHTGLYSVQLQPPGSTAPKVITNGQSISEDANAVVSQKG